MKAIRALGGLFMQLLALLVFVAAVVVLAMAFSGPASAQTPPPSPLTFALQTSSPDGKTIIPKLTWSTVPAAAGCTASGDWSGTKAASGTETLAAVSAGKAYTLQCSWPGDTTVTVAWSAPTLNVDGTAYTNPGGYRILFGTAADNLDGSAYLQDPAARTWTKTGLAAGTWWFQVSAFNANGLESTPAPVPPVSKVITAASTQSRSLTLGFTVPGAATGVTAK